MCINATSDRAGPTQGASRAPAGSRWAFSPTAVTRGIRVPINASEHQLGADGMDAGMVAMALLALAAANLSERVAIEVAALTVLLALVGVGVIPVNQALSGYDSEAVWLVVGMMVVAEGIRQSGLLARVADMLTRLSSGSTVRLRLGVTLAGAVAGGILESTAAVMGMLPIVATAARRLKRPVGGFYVALALGAMAGGLTTLIGTSGNIVANSALLRLHQPGLGFFTLLPLGLGFLMVAALYVGIFGAWLEAANKGEGFLDLRSYVGEVEVPSDSFLAGKKIEDIKLFRDYGITVIEIFRGTSTHFAPGPTDRVLAEDRLIVSAPAAEHLRWREIGGLKPVVAATQEQDAKTLEQSAAEMMVPPGSPWVGRTVQQLRLRQQGVLLVAIWRQGETIRRHLASTPLRTGDVLLLQGDLPVLDRLESLHITVRVLGDREVLIPPTHPFWAIIPLAVFFGLAAFGIGNLGVDALAGAVLALLLGVLTPGQAYASVEWRVPILLGAVLPLAAAVSTTGLASFVARFVESVTQGSPILAIIGIYVLAAILTQVLSNIATAAVMTPIAVQVAKASPVTSETLVVTLLAALMMTPLSGTANKPALLVMGSSHFHHRDYLKFGLVPSLAGGILTLILVMAIWVR